MSGLLVLFLLIPGVASVAGADPARLSQTDKTGLAREVKGIFRSKCAKCHGPEGVRKTEKPKGDFDYVLDLEKLGSNPEMIVRGEPNESKLFIAVDDELMPDADADEKPLPANEKEIIRRWILAGAPAEKGVSP